MARPKYEDFNTSVGWRKTWITSHPFEENHGVNSAERISLNPKIFRSFNSIAFDFWKQKQIACSKNEINDDGSVKIIQETVYDTLSNGKIVARALPGEISQKPVDDQETYLRTNFDKVLEELEKQ